MNNKMSIKWEVDDNEEGKEEPLTTTIELENDDNGNVWLSVDMDRNNKFKRLIIAADTLKLSRFFYNASDFIKRDYE